MADSSEYPVYLGVWTNWSHGKLSGLTLTLTNRNGALLTAFLALFVTFTSTCFWRIASFGLHQYLSAKSAEDGLYHQRQSVLRNTSSGTSGLLGLIKIFLAWRKNAYQPYYRLLPLIVVVSLSVSAFAAAGVFSAKIGSETGNEVLVTSSTCGQIYTPEVTLNLKSTFLYPFYSRDLTSAASYAQRCYSNSSSSSDCNTYIKKMLKSTVDRNASCPFHESICRHQSRNIKLDTGYIDSHGDLGINAPPDHRIAVRLVDHCAPLVSDGRTQLYNYSDDISYMRYYYGNQTVHSKYVDLDFTYEHERVNPPQMDSEGAQYTSNDYSLG